MPYLPIDQSKDFCQKMAKNELSSYTPHNDIDPNSENYGKFTEFACHAFIKG